MVFTITAYKVSIPFPPIYNQSIPIYLSIGIDNRYQSITKRIFAIDWSSIININRLIDIDWYRLISIVIDYRFHRLDTPGDIPQKVDNIHQANVLRILAFLPFSFNQKFSFSFCFAFG